MSIESVSSRSGDGSSTDEEKKMEREMIDAAHRTLKLSKEVSFGEDRVTGIDVRNLPPTERKKFGISQAGDEKQSAVVYPPEGEDTSKLYVRSMKTGGIRSGRSIRAYVDKDRGRKRKGQHISVTTDYNSEAITEWDSPQGSKTTVTVYDDNGEMIREREHESDGVGFSPLVTKIVTKGIDAQIQKVKDGKKGEAK